MSGSNSLNGTPLPTTFHLSFRTSLRGPTVVCVSAACQFASRKMPLLSFAWGRKEVSHVIVEKGQPGRTHALGIRIHVHSAADGARLQLDGPVAAVPVSFQNAFQIGARKKMSTQASADSFCSSPRPTASAPVQDGRPRRGIYLPSIAPGCSAHDGRSKCPA